MRNFRMLLLGTVALVLASLSSRATAQEEEMEDPLGDVSVDMQLVATKLAKFATDKPTQETEQQVIAKLDALIKKLEQELDQMGQNGGRAGNRPKNPAKDSIIRDGPGGMGDLHAARQQGKQWGTLPPKERERIMQSLTDGFPPHYQEILEKYYRRMADEKPLSETGAENSPATNAARNSKVGPQAPKGKGA